MVKLAREDIRTRDVLEWTGVHLFHFAMSSCSAKTRIFLNLKRIEWISHPVDLPANEHIGDWFLGINPRGLVPVLVHDGDVHIESNDILLYLEKIFPEPSLIPAKSAENIGELLQHEDDLHFDLRSLSFRFVFNPPTTPKPPEVLERYRQSGSGTVQGVEDAGKAAQIAYWQNYASAGIEDAAVRESVQRFRAALDGLEARLHSADYLLGSTISLLDIAWFIYADRLALAGYPIARLHPRLGAWFQGLSRRPEFAKEVMIPPPVQAMIARTREQLAATGQTLERIAGLA